MSDKQRIPNPTPRLEKLREGYHPVQPQPQDGDIVTRLRELYALYERDANELAAQEHDYCASGCPDREAAQMMQEAEIYKDAADEIERLRVALKEAYRKLGPYAVVNLNG